MEKELKDYLDQNFAKLATKEEVNSIKGEVNGLKNELKALEERVLHQYHITAEAMGRPIFSGGTRRRVRMPYGSWMEPHTLGMLFCQRSRAAGISWGLNNFP